MCRRELIAAGVIRPQLPTLRRDEAYVALANRPGRIFVLDGKDFDEFDAVGDAPYRLTAEQARALLESSIGADPEDVWDVN